MLPTSFVGFDGNPLAFRTKWLHQELLLMQISQPTNGTVQLLINTLWILALAIAVLSNTRALAQEENIESFIFILTEADLIVIIRLTTVHLTNCSHAVMNASSPINLARRKFTYEQVVALVLQIILPFLHHTSSPTEVHLRGRNIPSRDLMCLWGRPGRARGSSSCRSSWSQKARMEWCRSI